MKNKGLTLIEMLIVISLVSLLSTFLIIYSHAGENRIILFKEQAQIISVLNRAKALSIQMFSEPTSPCAFGVNFSKSDNSFLIFKDLAADCKNSDNIYSGSQELFNKYRLDSRIQFQNLTLNNIIFIPPDPKVLIDNNSNENEASIILEISDKSASLKVKINKAGQITTQ